MLSLRRPPLILHAGLRDVEAYIDYARKFGPKVLELGSGTGRILVPHDAGRGRIQNRPRAGLDCRRHTHW